MLSLQRTSSIEFLLRSSCSTNAIDCDGGIHTLLVTLESNARTQECKIGHLNKPLKRYISSSERFIFPH